MTAPALENVVVLDVPLIALFSLKFLSSQFKSLLGNSDVTFFLAMIRLSLVM
jgi:hypothetical protein